MEYLTQKTVDNSKQNTNVPQSSDPCKVARKVAFYHFIDLPFRVGY
jgi:hypothetical protein